VGIFPPNYKKILKIDAVTTYAIMVYAGRIYAVI